MTDPLRERYAAVFVGGVEGGNRMTFMGVIDFVPGSAKVLQRGEDCQGDERGYMVVLDVGLDQVARFEPS